MNEIFPDLEHGLELLGWQYDGRLTSDDSARLWQVAETALDANGNTTLNPALRDVLALKAYQILRYQLAGPLERADVVSCTYYNSKHFRSLVPLIDEATICFFRGYYTASLSLLFGALEAALLSIFGWRAGDRKPTFAVLSQSVLALPGTQAAQLSHRILNDVFSRYEADNPTAFLYNRHGLLHGLRTETTYDEMNCARTLHLFDIICEAEEVDRAAYGDSLEMFGHRSRIYEGSQSNKIEQMLLSVRYPDV